MRIAVPPFLLVTALLFMAPSWAATTGSAHSLQAQESSTGGESSETDLLDSDLDSIDDLFGGSDGSNGSDGSDSPLDEEDLFGSSDPDDTTGDAAGDMAGDAADNADGDAQAGDKQAGDEQAGQGPTILETVVKKKRFTFGASYSFIGGIAPGWTAPPWYWDDSAPAFTWLIGAEMNSSFFLDFQLSQSLRVRQTFNLSFPGFVLSVGDFFADYSLANRAFIRLGKYGVAWGIAPNYSYANLPARIGTGFKGDSYAVKVDIPVGIGGLQLLTMVRAEEANFNDITANDLAVGGKFNLALQGADINIGTFYHPALRFRNSLSVKSTIFGNTEVYAEGMLSMHQESFDNPLFAASIGFMDDFFANRISVNAEYGYNGEVQSEAETLGTSILDDGSTVVLSGHNLALNLILRPRLSGILFSLRFFGRVKYNIDQNSGEVIPGLNWKPLESMDIYLAVPMAVGSRSGHYYTNTVDEDGRPFAVVLAVTLSGNY